MMTTTADSYNNNDNLYHYYNNHHKRAPHVVHQYTKCPVVQYNQLKTYNKTKKLGTGVRWAKYRLPFTCNCFVIKSACLTHLPEERTIRSQIFLRGLSSTAVVQVRSLLSDAVNNAEMFTLCFKQTVHVFLSVCLFAFLCLCLIAVSLPLIFICFLIFFSYLLLLNASKALSGLL